MIFPYQPAMGVSPFNVSVPGTPRSAPSGRARAVAQVADPRGEADARAAALHLYHGVDEVLALAWQPSPAPLVGLSIRTSRNLTAKHREWVNDESQLSILIPLTTIFHLSLRETHQK